MFEKGEKLKQRFEICSKVNQFNYTFVCKCMLTIRILALADLQLFYSQGYSHKMPVSEKGEYLNKKFTIYAQKLISSFTS